MVDAYKDKPTVALPGSDGTISGTAINDWLDDEGNPKFGDPDEHPFAEACDEVDGRLEGGFRRRVIERLPRVGADPENQVIDCASKLAGLSPQAAATRSRGDRERFRPSLPVMQRRRVYRDRITRAASVSWPPGTLRAACRACPVGSADWHLVGPSIRGHAEDTPE